MTPAWKRHIHKAADIILELPPGHEAWGLDMFEPLLIAIFFPFINSRPWQLKGSPAILELGRKVQQMFKGNIGTKGYILREFWNLPRRLQTMSDELVPRVLRLPGKAGVSSTTSGKRRRREMEEEERVRPFQSR